MTDTTASVATPAVKIFADFGVDDSICAALADAGIIHPFPIQELTLQLAIQGADLIGQARTGTGKTLAFGIPLLQRIDPASRAAGPRALVIVPTRELCLQVRDDLARTGARKGVEVLPVYGGKSLEEQVQALERGVDIVVGTPGRLLDLLRRGSLVLSTVTGLVLDEADEMLDLGFLPDVEQLIQATSDDRQTLLFSATMPGAVVALARRYMDKPTFMRADVEEVRIGPDTAQYFFSCHRMDKPAVLARMLKTPERGLCVVFSRTKRMADILVEDLRSQGVNAAAIHSDLRQDARERAMKSFRAGKTDVLVATEVAARGLDITDVTHVVNYDCPDDEKMYLHRIGRTGRAGAAGVAITLALWNEAARLEMIKKALGITEPTHEVFSTSPILDELFDLPPRESRTTTTPAPSRPKREASERPKREAADKREGTAGSPSRRARGGKGRRRSTSAAADEPAAQRKVSATPDGGGERGETMDHVPVAGEVVRRVRTRRRGADASSPRPAAIPPERPEDAGEDQATDSDQAAPQQRPAPRPRRDTGESGQTRTRDSGQSRDSRGRRRTERSSAPRADQRREPARRPVQRASTPVDSDAARGAGRPRLSRPLVISYLP